MLRRNTKRLCKFAACLATTAIVCYMFGKCEDFVPALLRKIDGFSEQVNQLVPRMHTMLKSSLNNTIGADLRNRNRLATESDSSYSNRKAEAPAQTSTPHDSNEIITKPARKSQNKQLKDQRIGFSISQSDFIKVFDTFAQRQSAEAELRQNLFKNVLKNLTRILEQVHRKEHENNLVAESRREQSKRSELMPVINPIYTRYKNENLITKTKRNGKENMSDIKIDSAVQKAFNKLKTFMPSKKIKISSTMTVDKLPENFLRTEMPKTRSNEVTFGSTVEFTNKITTPTKGHPVSATLPFTKASRRHTKSRKELLENIPKEFAVRNKSLLSTTKNSSNLFELSGRTNSKKNFSTENRTKISSAFKQKTTFKFLNTQANTTAKRAEAIKNVASFKQHEKRFMDESTLNHRAEVFLRKIKKFGMTYSERLFHYKRRQNSSIFYREVLPVWGGSDTFTIFLLHDFDHDSKIWLSTGTFYSLGIQGHRVVALDLPGYGKSMNISELDTSLERLKLLASFMFTVSPKGPRVLVSPGESGAYSVPMVMSASVMLKGVVFVSTAYTGKFPASKYENVYLPALVIHGENDTSAFLKEFKESMNHLPNSERIYSFEHSGRYCYIEKPDDFHRLLNKFLSEILPQRKKSSNKSRLQES